MTAKHPFAICEAEGCDRRRTTRVWCHAHYEQWRRSGGTVVPAGRLTKFAPAIERFWLKVDKQDNGCWLWTGSRYGNGRYGKFEDSNAHRWAYEHFVGRIPLGMQIDHLCRVRVCVNPAHLEPVTARENMWRGNSPSIVAARSGKCRLGHDLPTTPNYQGKRVCEICKRDNRRRKTLASASRQRCPRYIKEQVWGRCGGACEFCGFGISTIRQMHVHHRKMRSQGGDWSLPNLMGVHQACHNTGSFSIHANPARSYKLGHLVRSGDDPAAIPVQLLPSVRPRLSREAS